MKAGFISCLHFLTSGRRFYDIRVTISVDYGSGKPKTMVLISKMCIKTIAGKHSTCPVFVIPASSPQYPEATGQGTSPQSSNRETENRYPQAIPPLLQALPNTLSSRYHLMSMA